MTTRPGYVWDGGNDEWVEIGQAAVLAPVKYQATPPSSPATGDIWIDSDDEVPGITSSLNYRWRRIATGGETSLSGNDSSGLPLAYNPGYEQVYLNGVLQYRGSDYVATTGNTITGLTALVANDTIEVLSFVTAPIGDSYTQVAADSRFVNKNVGGLNLVVPTGATNGTVGANGAVTVGTGVSSVTISGAFSATYDNYKILYSGGVASATIDLLFTLSGITTNYWTSLTYAAFNGTGIAVANSQNAATFSWTGAGTTSNTLAEIEIQNPFLAKTKMMNATYNTMNVPSGNIGRTHGFINNTTSATGFTLACNTGTITGGTIRIYGYNNGA
jgi:hypothetical protein